MKPKTVASRPLFSNHTDASAAQASTAVARLAPWRVQNTIRSFDSSPVTSRTSPTIAYRAAMTAATMATLTSRRLPFSALTPSSVNAAMCMEQQRCNVEAAAMNLHRRRSEMVYKHDLAEAHELSAPTGAIVYHAVRKEG